MRSNKRPEWLPSDWTVKIKNSAGKKHKCYLDPNGRKFYSKPEVSRYLEKIKNNTASEKNCNADESTGDVSLEPDVSHKNGVPESLPPGDKSSSEPNMLLNSEAADVGHNISTKEESIKEVISRTQADGLPPGWIKEVRIRKTSVCMKKDPYYLDPSSDYVFFSKLDALRYLDTGDIETCAMKPRIRDTSGSETKLVNTTTRRQLFEGDILQDMKIQEKLAKGSNRMNKSKKSSATQPGRSSKRLKGLEPETKSGPLLKEQAVRAQSEVQSGKEKNEGNDQLEDSEAVQGKQLNVEKPTKDIKREPQHLNPHRDSNWTDPCLDFAVRTLKGEIPFEVPSIAASLQQESLTMEASKNENAMKTEV